MIKYLLFLVKSFMTFFTDGDQVSQALIAVPFVGFVVDVKFPAISITDNTGVVITL
jgi:hypothetical protein